jgi:type II secretion system protein H
MKNTAAHSAREGGFTLVEVLMVVFIVGLSAGLIVLTLPQRDSASLVEAKAFASNLKEVQDIAILSGQPTGIRLSERGYSVVAWRRDAWTAQRGGRTFPSSVGIEVREPLGERPEDWPDLIFGPTTVNAAMSFRIRGGSDRIDVSINEGGEVQIEQR